MNKPIWLGVVCALAGIIAVAGWWFDYSDAGFHASLAVILAGVGIRAPRAAASMAAAWVLVGICAGLAFPLPSPPAIESGTPEEKVVQRFGKPVFRGSVEQLYDQADWGYSRPNPRRTSAATNVLAYYHPGGVFYVFMKKEKVVTVGVGGS